MLVRLPKSLTRLTLIMHKACKHAILALVGGIIYGALEILFRGCTHWSMVILGGVCFVIIGELNEVIPWNMPLILQMLCGCIIITTLEFCCGCIVNIWLGWSVWDYSNEWGNLLGQICPKYSMIWYFVSLFAILLDDWLRYELWDEEKPHYRVF